MSSCAVLPAWGAGKALEGEAVEGGRRRRDDVRRAGLDVRLRMRIEERCRRRSGAGWDEDVAMPSTGSGTGSAARRRWRGPLSARVGLGTTADDGAEALSLPLAVPFTAGVSTIVGVSTPSEPLLTPRPSHRYPAAALSPH